MTFLRNLCLMAIELVVLLFLLFVIVCCSTLSAIGVTVNVKNETFPSIGVNSSSYVITLHNKKNFPLYPVTDCIAAKLTSLSTAYAHSDFLLLLVGTKPPKRLNDSAT